MRQLEVTRPVLRYFGGKWRLAPWIISHFGPHRVYVEPYGGAASVLMQKPRSFFEVYNDIDGDTVNVFRVMQRNAEDLRPLLEYTPWAREEYELAHKYTDEPIERARRTILRSFMGYAGDATNIGRKTGFRGQSKDAANKPACRDWFNYLPCLEQFTDRLRDVVIEHIEALKVIEKYDSPNTLFYLDPPYTHAERSSGKNYTYEMGPQDHEDLIAAALNCKGMVLLSGYDNPAYAKLGWECDKMTSKMTVLGNETRTEVLWMNPAAMKAQSQQSLFASAPQDPQLTEKKR